MTSYKNSTLVSKDILLMLRCKRADLLRSAADFLKDEISTKRTLRACIEIFKEDESYRTFVLSNSYIHDNGFVKLVLCGGHESSGQIRLHFWDGKTPTKSNIHNHTRSYYSRVLEGKLSIKTYGAGSSLSRYRFQYNAEKNGDYELQPIGWSTLDIQGEDEVTVGRCHFGKSDLLHQIQTESGYPTTSLFIQGAPEHNKVEVYMKQAFAISSSLHRLSKCEVIKIISRVL